MFKIILLIILSNFAKVTLTCNNYELIINKIVDCNKGKDSIIRFENFGLSLDKDCNIIPTGCIDIKGFNTATLHYAVTKTSMAPIEGDMDLCDTLKSNTQKDVSNAITAIGIPNQCPIRKMRICKMKQVNIVKYKPLLALLKGVMTIKANVVHNTGVTCTDIQITIQKIKRT